MYRNPYVLLFNLNNPITQINYQLYVSMVTLPLPGWVFIPTLVLVPSDKDVITHPFGVRIIGACWGTLP